MISPQKTIKKEPLEPKEPNSENRIAMQQKAGMIGPSAAGPTPLSQQLNLSYKRQSHDMRQPEEEKIGSGLVLKKTEIIPKPGLLSRADGNIQLNSQTIGE